MKVIQFLFVLALTTLFGCDDLGDLIGCDGGSNDPIDAEVIVVITVADLPDTITYNKTTTPDNTLEYSWGVTFDMNGDGVINEGDLALRIMHFKSPGSTEQTGTIDDFQTNLWLYTSNSTAQVISSATVRKWITGNTIRLFVEKTAYSKLEEITVLTLVYFQTSIYDSNDSRSYYDYYPSYLNYVNIPTNKQFTDDQGDVSFPEIDMVTMGLSF